MLRIAPDEEARQELALTLDLAYPRLHIYKRSGG